MVHFIYHLIINSYLLLHQYLFCIKQANKICIMLGSHLIALKYNFWCRSDMCTPVICVFPRTHITSDMCTPGGDTKNTEALYPGLQRLEGKHGGYEGKVLWVYILKVQPIQNGRRSECKIALG